MEHLKTLEELYHEENTYRVHITQRVVEYQTLLADTSDIDRRTQLTDDITILQRTGDDASRRAGALHWRTCDD